MLRCQIANVLMQQTHARLFTHVTQIYAVRKSFLQTKSGKNNALCKIKAKNTVQRVCSNSAGNPLTCGILGLILIMLQISLESSVPLF